jgi:UDP-GlcNAc:undecaprenyl-phosphate GlcNAc-1-phosphate transferase
MVWNELTDNLEVLWGGLIALGIVVLLTPAVGGMARLLGVVDRSEEGRRSTRAGVPRLGGLALFLGIFVPSLAFLDLNREMRGILLGAAIATTVGAIDDFRGPRWWEKLAGQAAAAVVVVWAGVWVHRFTFPLLGVQELPKEVGMTLTVVGIVAVMNMVNFLDGLDGLAAGVCAISAFLLRDLAAAASTPRSSPQPSSALHRLPPPQLLPGGSSWATPVLLRVHLATVSVEGLLKTATLVTLVLPLLVLAVPLIDTSFVVAKRIKHGKPVYVADRTHLHHRFENIGFSQRRSVVYLYGWCATLAIAALATRFVHPHRHGHWDAANVALDAVIGLLAIGASIYVVYLLEIVQLANPFIRRREEAEREQGRTTA